MRKDILISIILGITVGLTVAFGVWRANVALRTNNQHGLSSTGESSDSFIETVPELKIVLARPGEYEVLTETPTKISGLTRPESWIIVSAEDEDYITKSETDGAFELEIKLIAGINQLLIKVFDEKGNSASENLTLVYSSVFEEDQQ